MLKSNVFQVYRTRAKAVSSKPIFNAGTERFIRDWRSAIVTIAVRDQRYRQHDPILGVVPLKLSDILQTRSQVTRWYPLDGGVGFGRIRVSLLFRSVETRLPQHMLGWDVGTFRIVSDRITAKGFNHRSAKLKLRTSGASASVSRSASHSLEGGDGVYLDLRSDEAKHNTRLPLKHRYRSAVVLELHNSSTTAYSVLWLQEIADNEDTPIDLPIWTTKNPQRLTQNYITEKNLEEKRTPGLEDVTEIGRLQFSCHFAPGLSDAHESLIVDNNSRETYEAWEACVAEGVRNRRVKAEVPENIKELHDKSLINERDVLRQNAAQGDEDKERWFKEHGLDWSMAFGDNPHALADFSKETDEDLENRSIHSADLDSNAQVRYYDPQHGNNALESHGDETQHTAEELQDIESMTTSQSSDDYETTEERQQRLGKRENKRTEKRKLRGSMQWAPARNAAFVKDEASFALKKVKKKFTGGLTGREPDVETELG